MNEEFLVGVSHQLTPITSLPFVHTARRYYRLNGLVRSSDWVLAMATLLCIWEDDRTWSFRGSKSRNKVSVGEPAEGSLYVHWSLTWHVTEVHAGSCWLIIKNLNVIGMIALGSKWWVGYGWWDLHSDVCEYFFMYSCLNVDFADYDWWDLHSDVCEYFFMYSCLNVDFADYDWWYLHSDVCEYFFMYSCLNVDFADYNWFVKSLDLLPSSISRVRVFDSFSWVRLNPHAFRWWGLRASWNVY